MAEFIQGEHITASKMNEINATPFKVVNFPDAANHIQDYIGNDGIWYSHVPSGGVLFNIPSLWNGWFGGGRLVVQKLDNNMSVVSTLFDKTYGWNTNTSITINSIGAGWYRAYSADNWEFGACTINLYAWQTDCIKGNKLTMYDEPQTSGNRLTGDFLTHEMLNSGRGGTINS